MLRVHSLSSPPLLLVIGPRAQLFAVVIRAVNGSRIVKAEYREDHSADSKSDQKISHPTYPPSGLPCG